MNWKKRLSPQWFKESADSADDGVTRAIRLFEGKKIDRQILVSYICIAHKAWEEYFEFMNKNTSKIW